MQDPVRSAHLAGLTAALTAHFSTAVTVTDMEYLHGGGSRILGRFTATIGERAERLVFRLDPPSSFVESDRATEFAALKFLHGSTIPVPQPIMLDAAGTYLGAPCFIMSEIASGSASGFFDRAPYADQAAKVGEQVFAMVGRLAALVVDGDIRAALGDPGTNPASTQLDHWEKVLDSDERWPQPIARAGIRALRHRMPPPPPALSVVHGDFRSGNFLVDSNGNVVALLDWEFVHLGDPLEDLAWCIDPLWGHGMPEIVGGMLPLDHAIAAWEAASGMRVDIERLDWWRLFSAIKGMAMWTSSADEFLREGGGEPRMAFPVMNCVPVHERVIAETLCRWGDAP